MRRGRRGSRPEGLPPEPIGTNPPLLLRGVILWERYRQLPGTLHLALLTLAGVLALQAAHYLPFPIDLALFLPLYPLARVVWDGPEEPDPYLP